MQQFLVMVLVVVLSVVMGGEAQQVLVATRKPPQGFVGVMPYPIAAGTKATLPLLVRSLIQPRSDIIVWVPYYNNDQAILIGSKYDPISMSIIGSEPVFNVTLVPPAHGCTLSSWTSSPILTIPRHPSLVAVSFDCSKVVQQTGGIVVFNIDTLQQEVTTMIPTTNDLLGMIDERHAIYRIYPRTIVLCDLYQYGQIISNWTWKDSWMIVNTARMTLDNTLVVETEVNYADPSLHRCRITNDNTVISGCSAWSGPFKGAFGLTDLQIDVDNNIYLLYWNRKTTVDNLLFIPGNTSKLSYSSTSLGQWSYPAIATPAN